MRVTEIVDSYALSPMQESIVFQTLYDRHAGLYIEQFIFDFPDTDLNIGAFRQSWETVLARHATLRASFHWQDLETPLQRIHPTVQLSFEVHDWRERPATRRARRFEAYLRADRQKGFIPGQAPLMRVAVFQMQQTHYQCVWTFHHLLADGRSAVTILQEVFALYEALCQGSAVTWPPARSFREHIASLEQRDANAEEIFWRRTLKGFTAPTPLVVDRSSSTAYSGSPGQCEIRLDASVTSTLRTLADRYQLTLNTFVQGSWALLLSRYSGEEDVVFGVTRACRRSTVADADRIVGVFMNTVPMRVRASEEASLIPWLTELRSQQVAVRNYEHTRPVDVQRWSALPAGTPLFESVIDFSNYSLHGSLHWLGPRWETSTLRIRDKTNYPLAIFASADGNLSLRIVYDRGRFDQDTVRRMLGHLETLLAGMAREPEQRLRDLPLLSEAERHQLLVDWNNTAADYPRDACLHHLVEAQVARTPDRPAACFEDRQLTYDELNARANQLAHYLEKVGVRPAGRVGICVERSLDMMVALLGVVKAGAAYVPLDPSFPKERLAFILDDAGIEALVTQERLAGNFAESSKTEGAQRRGRGGVPMISLDADGPAISRECDENPAVRISPENLAYVMYTSGSTGKPKGVMVRHRNVVNFFGAMDSRLGDTPPGVWLAVTSISFDISVLELFWPLTRGFKVVVQSNEEITAAPPELRPLSSINHRRPVDFSLFYFASSEDGVANNKYQLLLEGAAFADKHGFAAVWTPERHFHRFGGLYPNPSVTSAAIAAVTERIQVRAGSVVLPLQNPIRVAEEWAVVDNISGGRVGISFASGWHANDFALAPENYADRKAITVREMETVRRLWRGDTLPVTNGAQQEIQVRIYPQPVQGELPTWLTAAGDPETFRTAGEMGANLLTHLLGHTVEGLAEKIALYRKAWSDHRNDHGKKGDGHVTLMLHTFVGENIDEVRETVRDPLINYLKTSSDLVRKLSPAMADDRGLNQLSEHELRTLHNHAFERFFQTSGLLGTPDTCVAMIERLRTIGIDEVACLIDFGVETRAVMRSLELLNRVREMIQQTCVADRDFSIPAQIARHGVTHMQCTPSMARMLAARPESLSAVKPLRKLLLGGEALPDSLADTLSDVVSGDILNMYGPTETTVWSTTAAVERGRRPAPIGRPIANTQTYVVDRYLRPVPVGVPGELVIGGDGVAEGYLDRPELTAEKFILDRFSSEPGRCLYRTGDVARYLPNGDIAFLGRADDQVKIRGHRIELGEIEAVLHQYPGVLEAAVVAREDQPGDQRLVGYVVPSTNDELTPDELRGYLKAKLAKEMVPAVFVMLSGLPRTPNGKINRRALPAPDFVRPDSEKTFATAQDAVERQLTAIWERVLGVHPIGVNDNFFELGGHSLLAVNLFAQIEKAFGKALALARLFEAPTIAGLADILRRDAGRSSWSSLVPIQTAGARTPLFLVHAGHGNVLLYRQLAKHLGPNQPVYGLQSEALNGSGRFGVTIEEMAAVYAKDIVNAHPHGPYVLGGYCLGGIIAFEIAQQLTALGKVVKAVILLDTYNPSTVSRARTLSCIPVHWLQNLYFHAINTLSVGRMDREQFVREKVAIALMRLESTLRSAGLILKRLVGTTGHRGGRVMVKRLNDRAASRYVPKPYNGHVILIRPKGYFVGFTDPSYGWHNIARNRLVVRELTVYPKGMLIDPFCRELANTISSETDRAAAVPEDTAAALVPLRPAV